MSLQKFITYSFINKFFHTHIPDCIINIITLYNTYCDHWTQSKHIETLFNDNTAIIRSNKPNQMYTAFGHYSFQLQGFNVAILKCKIQIKSIKLNSSIWIGISDDNKYAYNKYEDLLKLNEIDAVYISTLNNTHLDLIVKSAQNKNIFFVKSLLL